MSNEPVYSESELQEDAKQPQSNYTKNSIASNLRKSLKVATNTRNPLNREIMKGGLTNDFE